MKPPSLEIFCLEPWNGVEYEQALALQAELCASGRHGWLLFCCPPTITLGRRASPGDVLVSPELLRARGVRCLEVDRGGEVTYHGPGQLIGFPFGRLEQHVGSSRGVREFVVGFKQALSTLIGRFRELDPATSEDAAGLWILDGAERRKIVSIGLAFGRHGIRHGFALNVQPLAAEFALINPCGARQGPPAGALFADRRGENEVAYVRGLLVDILSLRR